MCFIKHENANCLAGRFQTRTLTYFVNIKLKFAAHLHLSQQAKGKRSARTRHVGKLQSIIKIWSMQARHFPQNIHGLCRVALIKSH